MQRMNVVAGVAKLQTIAATLIHRVHGFIVSIENVLPLRVHWLNPLRAVVLDDRHLDRFIGCGGWRIRIATHVLVHPPRSLDQCRFGQTGGISKFGEPCRRNTVPIAVHPASRRL